jgi:hypothetical protein
MTFDEDTLLETVICVCPHCNEETYAQPMFSNNDPFEDTVHAVCEYCGHKIKVECELSVKVIKVTKDE